MSKIKRITLQDVANACGLSRNTISKVFNDRGNVPQSTKDFVISKAREIGFLSPGQETEGTEVNLDKNIALLTSSRPMDHDFGLTFITSFTDLICRQGFNLKIFEISPEDLALKVLPPHFLTSNISGVVTIELFDREYMKMIRSLNLPLIMVDSYSRTPCELIDCNYVYVESYASTIALTNAMIDEGAKTLGFVGDKSHCATFRDRWDGFRLALKSRKIEFNKSVSILDDDSSPYGDVNWLYAKLKAMPYIPDAFMCANDFIAVRLIKALQKLGLLIPEDVKVCGFDGSPEAEIVSPALSTAKVSGSDVGKTAAFILLKRIGDVDFPFFSISIKSTPIIRESVRKEHI